MEPAFGREACKYGAPDSTDAEDQMIEIVWEETVVHKVTMAAYEARDLFGLGGTPAEEIPGRLALFVRTRELQRIEESGWVTNPSPTHWNLKTINGTDYKDW